MTTPLSVDEYLAALPADKRAVLDQLRDTVNAAAPMATEVIAYQMPALRLDGRFLVSYAAFKAHYSLFPASQAVVDALGDAVAQYLAGRGTFRFRASEPLPLGLISRIVRVRIGELGDPGATG